MEDILRYQLVKSEQVFVILKKHAPLINILMLTCNVKGLTLKNS